jgi:glycerol dehydrogenase
MTSSKEFKWFGSPDHYVQGKNILLNSADILKPYGSKFLLLADKDVYKAAGKKFQDYLTENGFTVAYTEFNGESSLEEIDRVTKIAKDKSSDVIIGLGGGKTLDTSKGVANALDIPNIICPSAASCDASCIKLSIIYTEAHEFVKYLFYAHHPILIMADTQVIAQAPTRTLLAGIGDAFSTYYEGLEVAKSHGYTLAGGHPTDAGLAVARQCADTLWKYSYQALEASENNTVTTALEKVVEANILLSGLGAEGAGLAAAHSIYDGFSVLKGDPGKFRHGEEVALGVMIQLVLIGTPQKELDKFIEFLLTCGFPLTKKEFHLDKVSQSELEAFAKKSTDKGETIENMSFKVSPEMILEALDGVDAAVTRYRETHSIHPVFVDKVFG